MCMEVIRDLAHFSVEIPTALAKSLRRCSTKALKHVFKLRR